MIISLEQFRIENSNYCSLDSTFKKELEKFLEKTPPQFLGEVKKEGSLWDKQKREFIPDHLQVSKWLSEKQISEIENGELCTLHLSYRKKSDPNSPKEITPSNKPKLSKSPKKFLSSIPKGHFGSSQTVSSHLKHDPKQEGMVKKLIFILFFELFLFYFYYYHFFFELFFYFYF